MPLPSNLKYLSCYKSHSTKTNRALSDPPEVVDEVSHCVNVQLLFVIRTLSHPANSLSGENKSISSHRKVISPCKVEEHNTSVETEKIASVMARNLVQTEGIALSMARDHVVWDQLKELASGILVPEDMWLQKNISGEIFSNFVCVFLLPSDICKWMCFDSNRHYLLIFWFSETKWKYLFCVSTSRLGLAPLPTEQSRRREKIVRAALPRSTYSLAFEAFALKFDW